MEVVVFDSCAVHPLGSGAVAPALWWDRDPVLTLVLATCPFLQHSFVGLLVL